MACMPREQALQELRSLWEVLAASPQGRSSELLPGIRFAAADPLLRHSGRDVRLWAAKCLAEGLRIFAPEPPLEPPRLRAALELFTEQISALSEARSASFMHRLGLLERLLEIRAFLLLFDCERPQELVTKLVGACLSAVEGAEGSNHLLTQLGELLAGVLAEADDLPAPVVAELVSVLIPTEAGQPLAARVAKRVLGGLANGSAVNVIHEVLTKELYGVQSEGGTAPKPVAFLFEGVYELFRINWTLVARILPNLAEDLQARDIDRRCCATRLIGRMFAHPTGPGESPLVEMQPMLFDRYLDRYADAEDQVRLQALNSAASFFHCAVAAGGSAAVSDGDSHIVALVTAAGRIRQQLEDRCLDPCQSVRLRVIEIAADAAKSPAGLELLAPVLPNIFGRIMDKRPLVREVCIDAISNLYMAHGLRAWVQGSPQEANLLSWAPQILCDAFNVFAGGHLGQTSLLEEYLERCFLGCDEGFDAAKRLNALLGFFHYASNHEGAKKGLALLLQRKRDANAVLRRFVELRMTKGAPLLVEEDAVALVASDHGPDPPEAQSQTCEAQELLKSFVRFCPASEDRAQQPETCMKQLRELDLIRDKALWSQLLGLLGGSLEVSGPSTMAELGAQLCELGRLLRVHNLTGMEPLLRRALLCTWLMPDQVILLLDKVSGQENAQAEASELMAVACNGALAELPRYFPTAFAAQTSTVIRRLREAVIAAEEASETSEVSASRAKLRALLNAAAALGKWSKADPSSAASHFYCKLHESDASQLSDAILQLPLVDVTLTGRDYRKAIFAIHLFAPDTQRALVQQVLQWANEHKAGTKGDERAAAALRLAAACVEQNLGGSALVQEDWLAAGCNALTREMQNGGESRFAAAELLAALGCEAEIMRVMSGGLDETGGLQIHASLVALRAVRHGYLELTTSLLRVLSEQVQAAVASNQIHALVVLDRLTSDADHFLAALQKFQKPSTCRLRLRCSLRLCATLPTLFSVASVRHQVDTANRLLQASLTSALRHSIASREPFVNDCVAYFLHFLSHLASFTAEAAMLVSSFPESTRLSTMFVDALLRCGTSKAMELAAVVLRVVDSTRYFADRERPDDSRAIDKAAWVLRFAVEKRCSELNGDFQKMLQRSSGSAKACSMPAELFVPKATTHLSSAPCLEEGAASSTKVQHALAESEQAIGADVEVPSQSLQALPATLLTPQTQRHASSSDKNATAEKLPQFASTLFQRLGRQRSNTTNVKPGGAASPRSAAFLKRQERAGDGGAATPGHKTSNDSEASTPSPTLRKTPRQTPKRRASLSALAALASNATDVLPASDVTKRPCTSPAATTGKKAKQRRCS